MTRRLFTVFIVMVISFSNQLLADDELIPLTISVNTDEKGDYLVIFRDRSTILINTKDLDSLGLIALKSTDLVDNEQYINLEQFSPRIVFFIDEVSLLLTLEVDPELLQKTRRNLLRKSVIKVNPLGIDSAFLNASANVRGLNDNSYRAMEFPLEGVVRSHDLLFQTNFTYFREDVDEEFVTGNWYRGLSSVTRDFPSRLQRLVIGDFSATSGELGGSGVFGGISFGKQFNMATYFTKYPGITVNGVLNSPSRINLYANGNLIRSEMMPAGEFELTNLPDLYGAGKLEIETEDSFGRKSIREVDYYVSTRLLREGLHDFNYSLGFRRLGLNKPQTVYDTSATFIGYHRYGINEYLTAGIRFEADNRVSNYGPSLNFLLGSLGELELKVSRSSFETQSAYAGLARYQFTSRYFHLRMFYRQNDEQYITTSSSNSLVWPRFIESVGFGIHGTRFGALSLGVSRTSYYSDTPQQILDVNYSTRLGKKTTFFLRAQNVMHAQRESKSIFASINVSIGNQVSASASVSDNNVTQETSGYLQKSTPVGEGSGFRFKARRVTNQTDPSREVEYPGELNIIAKTRYNVLNTTYFKEELLSSYSVQFATTMAFVDDHFFFTRPIYDSFGLVKVGELDNVRVYYSNEWVGNTHKGRLLIPNLTSYADNYLSIEAEDVPVDQAIKTTRKSITPNFRAGSVADFEVEKFQGFFGYIQLKQNGKIKTADYAVLTLIGKHKQLETMVGKGGEFYVENLLPDSYRAQVKLEGIVCMFDLNIPKAKEMIVDLGSHVCNL